MTQQVILPDGWEMPKGYSNGILAPEGRMLFIAGQIGWDENEKFHSEDLVPQFEQAVKNILTIVKKAGGEPGNICRMTCFCTSREEYIASRKALGAVWKKLMGKHYPAMSLIFVSDLVDHPAKIEIEGTAVIP